jgi:hypothetical protein
LLGYQQLDRPRWPEYILNAFNGANSASAATRAQAAAQRVVIANIATTRAAITALNLSKTLPIGTADAGSMITEALAEASDFIMANVHPFFAGVNIEDAAGWTWEYLETDTPSVALRASNRPTLYASEIGWPSDAAQNGSLTLNGSSASIEHLQLLRGYQTPLSKFAHLCFSGHLRLHLQHQPDQVLLV